MKAKHYFYAATARQELAEVFEERLEQCTERHRLKLVPGPVRPESDLNAALTKRAAGVVFEMAYGWPSRIHLRLARQTLKNGRRVFFYWPREEAVEHIDSEKLDSYWRLWLVVHGAYLYSYTKRQLKDHLRPYYHALRSPLRSAFGERLAAARMSVSRKREQRILCEHRENISKLIDSSAPVPFRLAAPPTPDARIKGTGIYLRTDFWAQISSGGSYGHTCYVAKELARLTENLTCYMPHRYTLLDELGLSQIVVQPPSARRDELTMIEANSHYHSQLSGVFTALRPTYLYERICLGNYVGARLSQELGIPYIVEYNGSEISMMRTFNGTGYIYEDIHLQAEAAAFRQATAISVISEAVRHDLVRRGVDRRKILVNPNGADIDSYAPADTASKSILRRELGFTDAQRVICFTGTFGGWHGVDILAAAVPEICRQAPEAQFLLIGDGNYKQLVDEQVRKHGLESRVHSVGRVPQQEGARLLGAADIFVSPHNSHMVDSRFFGSPTKIFEYMAMGGGIVASDLEQIGEVLSPALRSDRLDGTTRVDNERAVLCKPGALDEFIRAILFMVERPDIALALGRNARKAVESDYSWTRHVERLWTFVHALDSP